MVDMQISTHMTEVVVQCMYLIQIGQQDNILGQELILQIKTLTIGE